MAIQRSVFYPSPTTRANSAVDTSYLATQAQALPPGSVVELTGMGGLTAALVDAGEGENYLEYGHKGIYDPVRRKMRFLGGPHTTGKAMVCLEYGVDANGWSQASRPGAGYELHGYDHNAVDAAGNHFVRRTNSNVYDKWDGSAWASVTANNIQAALGEPACGFDWSPLFGLVTLEDSNGVTTLAGGAGSWVSRGTPPGLSGSFHFVCAAHKGNGTVWLQDANGQSNHWRMNADASYTTLAAPPISLGCAGTAGRFTTFDHRTGHYVVVDPTAGGHTWDFDLAADTWTDKGVLVPINDDLFEAFAVSISDFGGVHFYLKDQGPGVAPKALLYKHAL